MKKFKLILAILITIFLFNSIVFVSAQKIPEAPGTLEKAKSMGERVLKELPQVMKNVWQEALEIWQRIWNSYIQPLVNKIWQKIKSFFVKEIEQRKPAVEKEFEKEKQEMKEELPKVSKSLWRRFKELIK